MSTTVNLFINAVIIGAGLGVGYLIVKKGSEILVENRGFLEKISLAKAFERLPETHQETLNALLSMGKNVPKSAALEALRAVRTGSDRCIILIEGKDGTVKAAGTVENVEGEDEEGAPVIFGTPPSAD